MKSPVHPTPPSIDNNQMRKRILHAAFQSFTGNGYAGTSTLTIATRAKVSKRDLYSNFASKQAMLIACIKSRCDKMRIPEGLPEPRNWETLASALTAFGTNLVMESSHPDVIAMFRLAISEADRSPEIAEALEKSREATQQALSDLFAHARSFGLLRDGDLGEMASQCLTLLRDGLMISLLLGVISRPSHTQIQRHVAKAVTTFLQLYPESTHVLKPSKGAKTSRPTSS